MPRISADTIEEHVANQRAAALDAAIALFLERGYRNVTLADIAARIGLARNSLYRYFPDKTHFLVEWFHRTIPTTITAWQAATSPPGAPTERLHRWALTYLDWANTPEHDLIRPLIEALPDLDPATRDAIAAEHAEMMQIVADTVADTGIPAADIPATVELLAGLVLGAARTPKPNPQLRQRLLNAITALAQPLTERP
ncbi:MAG: TetR/AcrR family transcriptional regulator [Acidimicrobiales bacterium]|nr:TetR/AcrR family transcriptional regulator [Acidimicrobiales bacterium]